MHVRIVCKNIWFIIYNRLYLKELKRMVDFRVIGNLPKKNSPKDGGTSQRAHGTIPGKVVVSVFSYMICLV